MIQLLIMNFVIFGAVSINKIIVGGLAFGINSGAYVLRLSVPVSCPLTRDRQRQDEALV